MDVEDYFVWRRWGKQRIYREAVQKVTREDIVRNGFAPHPILHESAHQLFLRSREPEWFEAFNIIWMDPKFIPFWNDKTYYDTYYLTAKKSLIQEIKYQGGSPEIKLVKSEVLSKS